MRSCDELWAKGLFVQLGAYQHHAFLDWRLVVGDEKWQAVHDALNGAGLESVQEKWNELFGAKEEVIEEKVKKPVKKRATRKRATGEKKTKSKKTRTKKKIE